MNPIFNKWTHDFVIIKTLKLNNWDILIEEATSHCTSPFGLISSLVCLMSHLTTEFRNSWTPIFPKNSISNKEKTFWEKGVLEKGRYNQGNKSWTNLTV